jgi:drug/metabolite transporter (DMT)-like permease
VAFGIISIYTTIGCGLLWLVLGDKQTSFHISPGLGAMIVVSAILGIAIAHVCYYRALRTLGVAISSTSMLMLPFGVIGASAVIFKERLTPVQLLGGVVLIMGTGLLIWSHRRVS